jgi:amidophosphoribosyltransferase
MSAQRRSSSQVAHHLSGSPFSQANLRQNVDEYIHRHSNVYGIDMPSRAELVGHGRNTEEIAEAIGADLVIFQTLPDLISCVRQFNPSIPTFDCSVFTGEYVTGGVSEEYLHQLESLRAENVKHKGAANSRDSKSEGSSANGFHDRESAIASSGPINRADDTVGLHNTWNIS